MAASFWFKKLLGTTLESPFPAHLSRLRPSPSYRSFVSPACLSFPPARSLSSGGVAAALSTWLITHGLFLIDSSVAVLKPWSNHHSSPDYFRRSSGNAPSALSCSLHLSHSSPGEILSSIVTNLSFSCLDPPLPLVSPLHRFWSVNSSHSYSKCSSRKRNLCQPPRNLIFSRSSATNSLTELLLGPNTTPNNTIKCEHFSKKVYQGEKKFEGKDLCIQECVLAYYVWESIMKAVRSITCASLLCNLKNTAHS